MSSVWHALWIIQTPRSRIQGLVWPTNVSPQVSIVDKSSCVLLGGTGCQGLLSSGEALFAFPEGSVLFICGYVGIESILAVTDGIDMSLSI